MYTCSDETKVLEIYNSKAPRKVEDIYREIYPDCVIDCYGRPHAPCDGYITEWSEKPYRGGEYLPESDEASHHVYKVHYNFQGSIKTLVGSFTQIGETRAELKRQTLEIISKKSEYVGNIGERLEITLHLDYVKSFMSYYGPSILHICSDDNGNQIIYKGSVCLGKSLETIKVKAKIKSHNVHDGIHQTIIERPKKI